jgi:hypothetical protein
VDFANLKASHAPIKVADNVPTAETSLSPEIDAKTLLKSCGDILKRANKFRTKKTKAATVKNFSQRGVEWVADDVIEYPNKAYWPTTLYNGVEWSH